MIEENLTKEIEDLKILVKALENREDSLIKEVATLERQKKELEQYKTFYVMYKGLK